MITITKLNSYSKLIINEHNLCSIYHDTLDNTAHMLYVNGKTETITNVHDIQYDNNK